MTVGQTKTGGLRRGVGKREVYTRDAFSAARESAGTNDRRSQQRGDSTRPFSDGVELRNGNRFLSPAVQRPAVERGERTLPSSRARRRVTRTTRDVERIHTDDGRRGERERIRVSSIGRMYACTRNKTVPVSGHGLGEDKMAIARRHAASASFAPTTRVVRARTRRLRTMRIYICAALLSRRTSASNSPRRKDVPTPEWNRSNRKIDTQ